LIFALSDAEEVTNAKLYITLTEGVNHQFFACQSHAGNKRIVSLDLAVVNCTHDDCEYQLARLVATEGWAIPSSQDQLPPKLMAKIQSFEKNKKLEDAVKFKCPAEMEEDFFLKLNSEKVNCF